jgi:hypothetical protein
MFDHKYSSSDEMNYSTWFGLSVEELKWVLWPRRCYESNRLLWLELAYRSRRYFRLGDMDLITKDRWFSKNELIVLKLKY